MGGLRSSPQGPGGPPTGGGGGGGSGSGYGVNLDVMLSASKYVEHTGQTMKTGVQNLFDTLQLRWTGDARAAFDKAAGDWQTAMVHLTTALQEIANGLTSTHTNISQLEQETEAAINQTTRGLPYR
jgi:WXG100 family type VII secretion target